MFNTATQSFIDKDLHRVITQPDKRDANVPEDARNMNKLTQTLSKRQKLLSVNIYGRTEVFSKPTPKFETAAMRELKDRERMSELNFVEENRDSVEALMEAKALVQGYFKEADGKVQEDDMLVFLEEVRRLKQIEKDALNWDVLDSNEKLSRKGHSVVPSRAEVSLLAQKGLDEAKFKRLSGGPEASN